MESEMKNEHPELMKALNLGKALLDVIEEIGREMHILRVTRKTSVQTNERLEALLKEKTSELERMKQIGESAKAFDNILRGCVVQPARACKNCECYFKQDGYNSQYTFEHCRLAPEPVVVVADHWCSQFRPK